jgi:hypothetical protein
MLHCTDSGARPQIYIPQYSDRGLSEITKNNVACRQG